MAIYKKYRKRLLRQLTRKQRKEFKDYIQDISDEMLTKYADTIRTKNLPGINCVGMYKPIEDTEFGFQIYIQTIKN